MDPAALGRLRETLFTQLTPEQQQTLTIQLMERLAPGAMATDGGGANDGDDAGGDDENDDTDEAYEPTREGDENSIVADADTAVPAAENNAAVQAMQTLPTQITAQLRRIDDVERCEVRRARPGTTTPSTTPMRVPQATPPQAQPSAVVSADVQHFGQEMGVSVPSEDVVRTQLDRTRKRKDDVARFPSLPESGLSEMNGTAIIDLALQCQEAAVRSGFYSPLALLKIFRTSKRLHFGVR